MSVGLIQHYSKQIEAENLPIVLFSAPTIQSPPKNAEDLENHYPILSLDILPWIWNFKWSN